MHEAAQRDPADAKNAALAEAGAIVPVSYDGYGEKIKEVYDDLRAKGVIGEEPTMEAVLLTRKSDDDWDVQVLFETVRLIKLFLNCT